MNHSLHTRLLLVGTKKLHRFVHNRFSSGDQYRYFMPYSNRHRIVPLQQVFRSSCFVTGLLFITTLSLFARTIAYNYDFSQSLKNNAPNYSKHYTCLKSRSIKTKKPRALANITIPMAQSNNDLKKKSPLVTVSPFSFSMCESDADTSLLLSKHAAFLAPIPAAAPNLCVLYVIFRI